MWGVVASATEGGQTSQQIGSVYVVCGVNPPLHFVALPSLGGEPSIWNKKHPE